MDFKAIFKTAERFVVNNSPAIMTGIGVAGVVVTAIMTGKAAYSAALKIASERDAYPHEMTSREKAELVWKKFIPPVIVGTVSICAIVCANRVEARRAAALAAAFKISEKMVDEYREKVIQTVGTKAEEGIRSDLAGEKVSKTNHETIIIEGSEVLVYDERSDRAFPSSMERIRSAMNQINYQLNQQWCATLTEFYDLLGLKKTQESDEVGWTSDELLDVYFASTLVNGKPAIMINYNVVPARYFNRANH